MANEILNLETIDKLVKNIEQSEIYDYMPIIWGAYAWSEPDENVNYFIDNSGNSFENWINDYVSYIFNSLTEYGLTKNDLKKAPVFPFKWRKTSNRELELSDLGDDDIFEVKFDTPKHLNEFLKEYLKIYRRHVTQIINDNA